MASRPPRSVPTRGNQEAPFALSALDPVGLKSDSLLEGLEKKVFGSVVYLVLFVIGGMPAEPVVWHYSGDWGRLPLVATADDLDAPSLEPVEEGFQSGAGHCADLVPDDHTGNEFLFHPFGRPVRLVAPAEEAVIGLGQARISLARRWVGVKYGRTRSLAWFCRCPRRRIGSSADAGSGDRRGAARRGAGSEVLFRTDVVRLGEVGCVFHWHVEALALVTPLGWGNPISWWPRSCLVVVGETDAAMPFWVHLIRLVGPDALGRAERCFLYIDGIGCHSDGLVGF